MDFSCGSMHVSVKFFPFFFPFLKLGKYGDCEFPGRECLCRSMGDIEE